jgi:two-component system sensor histidine kinase QseC
MAVGLVLIFLVCGAILYTGVRIALCRQFDEALFAKARAFAALSNQTNDDIDGRRVEFATLPPLVQDAIRAEAQGGVIPEIEEVIDEGRMFYEVEYIRDGVESEFLVTASGDYVGPIDEFGFAIHDAGMPEFRSSGTPEYYQVWDEDGDVIAKSPSLERTNLPRSRLRSSAPAYVNLELPDGRNGRMVILRFRPRLRESGGDHDVEHLHLAMARSRADLDAVLRILLTALFLAGIILAAGAALVVRAAVKRGLAPLDALAEQAAIIDAGNLSTRFPTAQLPQELLPISTRLNELLERLEEAFSREKRFTADVAHELRTPIAELRALTEVGLRSGVHGSGDDGWARYLRDAHAIAIQMERIATALLTLARCEAGQQAADLQRTELIQLIRVAWTPFQRDADERRLRVAFHHPASALVETDPAMLKAMLSNLFSNAIAYTPRGGEIGVEVLDQTGSVQVRISNTNETIVPADLEHLFEPFWRKDRARTDTLHSGVGLSVVAAFARAAEIDVSADLPEPGVFTVALSIPRADGTPDMPRFGNHDSSEPMKL